MADVEEEAAALAPAAWPAKRMKFNTPVPAAKNTKTSSAGVSNTPTAPTRMAGKPSQPLQATQDCIVVELD